MDDWQETQLSNRHVHNRVGKGSKRGGGKSGGTFDVKRILGTYEVKCPAAGKLSTRDDDGKDLPRKLEIYTLNERGNAIFGELMLGGVLHASVLLAGSRKTMSAVVRELEEANEEGEEDEGEEEGKGEGESGAGAGEERIEEETEPGRDGDDNEDDDDEENDEDATANQRFREFEKNSFRSPKFWLRWQGSTISQAADSESSTSEQSVTGTGYFVFSGNQCDRFQGTLSCEPLEWDNVKITGWKLRSQPARDFAMTWNTE